LIVVCKLISLSYSLSSYGTLLRLSVRRGAGVIKALKRHTFQRRIKELFKGTYLTIIGICYEC